MSCLNKLFTAVLNERLTEYLNSSHTVPNARRAYEKSQHAEDFGRIKINLFL